MKTAKFICTSAALGIVLSLLTLALRAEDTAPAGEKPAAKLTLNADQPGPVINRNIYGHFSEHLGHCIYEGIWVGEDSPIPNTRGIRNDVVAALKAIRIPVLRWPGGCFADEYHWKDGIGPRESAPRSSTPTGAEWWRTITSARTSSWTFASRSGQSLTYAATWAAAPSKR